MFGSLPPGSPSAHIVPVREGQQPGARGQPDLDLATVTGDGPPDPYGRLAGAEEEKGSLLPLPKLPPVRLANARRRKEALPN